jgi:DNA-directed RNA polymerase-3 subunit RPC5
MPRTARVKKEMEEEPLRPMETADQSRAPAESKRAANTNDEEEDEVVREIDVYISPDLQSQLHLMQFPLQYREVPLPDAARVRPRHGMVELDQRIPSNTGTDGGYDMPSRTHVSHTIPVSTHMALGKLEYRDPTSRKAALHLIPLSHITQMRPSFSHVDESSATDASATAVDADLEEESEQQQQEIPKRKQPLMFQKKETERAAMARKSSHAYKKTSQDSEPWQELAVQDRTSLSYRRMQSAIPCPTPNKELVMIQEVNTDPSSSFVKSLNYLPESFAENVHDVDQPDRSTASRAKLISAIAQLSVDLTKLLHRGFPVPYAVIRAQFPSVGEQDLLTALSSCAVLVRGNFVLQSRLLQMPSPRMVQARTFILYLLQTLGLVQRSRLDFVFRDDESISAEFLLVLLRQVADKTTNGWKLKIDDDIKFCEAFPELAQLHSQYWERQAIRFKAEMMDYNEASAYQ